jgi:hypothetical protein
LTDAYVFGSDITNADFISFSYSSSDQSHNITGAENPFIQGGLNADGSTTGPAEELDIYIPYVNPSFAANSGDWVLAATAYDTGVSTKFTLVSGAVPEPSTWAMMLLGFAGLGLGGYRKVKQAGVASA